ncbi:MAG: glutamate--tRNA ligase, partial [Agathobacter sp.]|nr:glutamate--tRNA ligase [Agathobacter sp.]
ERDLPQGANVTRIGPSPTGFVHLGNLYNAIIAERLAHQSGGVFYLRIEDTDNKREVPGAVSTIINAMAYFGVNFDEGAVAGGDNGAYGPYRQRQRKDIYQTFAKWLVLQDKAYPCFLSEEEISLIRDRQNEKKEDIGIYGKYAEKNRNLSIDEIKEKIDNGEKWVLRFKGSMNSDYIAVDDAIRGRLEMPRNFHDFILLKSDGIPTYHFAHVVDDHLMRSTHVIRGEEWIPSLPIHIELFREFGWEHPIYCHTATLMKMEGSSKRKLSKRKDPELALSYYQEEGISQDAVWEFLLMILNSNYEEWRIANPMSDYREFAYTLEKMSISGALVDLDKLKDVSKNVISQMTAEEVYEKWHHWCRSYDEEFAALIEKYKGRTVAALSVGRGGEKPRRDIETWKQACQFMSFYYDEKFEIVDAMPEECDEELIRSFFRKYLESFDYRDDSAAWFDKVKGLTEEFGFAVKPKDYKKNPDAYKGSIVHITNMLRVALTGRSNAPDIWEVTHVLGEEIARERLSKWC